MKASWYYDVDDFRYEEIEIGTIGPGEVLLRMGACGVCGTDVHKAVFKTVKTPIVLGHEVSGEIAEVGPGVRDFVAGDRVFVTHHVPCLTCHYCRHGHHTLCRQFLETNIDPGGFSEYIRIPALNVKHCMYKIPADTSYEVAAMAEPLACCIRGLNLANLQPGDSVLVMGAGQIGIIHAQIDRQRMVSLVMVSDVSDFRLGRALELGADAAINVAREDLIQRVRELTEGRGVDVIIVAAGVSRLLGDAMAAATRGGTVLVFSPMEHDPLVQIDAGRFFRDEVRIIGSYSSSPLEMNEALTLLTRRAIQAERMITHRFALPELNQAIRLAHDPRGESLKIMVVP